jgi:hypothetical protein
MILLLQLKGNFIHYDTCINISWIGKNLGKLKGKVCKAALNNLEEEI